MPKKSKEVMALEEELRKLKLENSHLRKYRSHREKVIELLVTAGFITDEKIQQAEDLLYSLDS